MAEDRGRTGGQGPDAVGRYREAVGAWAERGRLSWLLGTGVAEVLAEIGAGTAAVDGEALVARLGRLVEQVGVGSRPQVAAAVQVPVVRAVQSAKRREPERVWQGQERRLDDRRYLVLFVGSAPARGAWVTLAVALDEQGHKHVAGVWDHSTVNAAVARAVVAELAGRGLAADRGLLAVVPGQPALEEAVRRTWGAGVAVAHCQHWVTHTVLAHLPEAARRAVAVRLRRAWSLPAAAAALELADLVEVLEREHPGAAAQLGGSRQAALTVAALGLPERLAQHLRVSGPPRVAIEHAAAAARPGQTGLAAVRAGLPAVVGRMRRLIGYEALPQLAQKLSRQPAGVRG